MTSSDDEPPLDDEIDSGSGNAPDYGGSDPDVPILIPHGNKGNTDPADGNKQEGRKSQDLKNYFHRASVKIRWMFSNAAAWSAFASVVMAGGTIAYTIYAHNQWKVLSGQLTEMQGSSQQTDKLLCLYQQQLDQITKQANDTSKLANASAAQADSTKRLFIINQEADRSWVVVTHPRFLIDKEWHFVVILTIANFGHSTAKNVIVETRDAVMLPLEKGHEGPPTRRQELGILAPSQTADLPVTNVDEMGYAHEPFSPGSTAWNIVVGGKDTGYWTSRYVYTGTIYYDDVSGPVTQPFCVFVNHSSFPTENVREGVMFTCARTKTRWTKDFQDDPYN